MATVRMATIGHGPPVHCPAEQGLSKRLEDMSYNFAEKTSPSTTRGPSRVKEGICQHEDRDYLVTVFALSGDIRVSACWNCANSDTFRNLATNGNNQITITSKEEA